MTKMISSSFTTFNPLHKYWVCLVISIINFYQINIINAQTVEVIGALKLNNTLSQTIANDILVLDSDSTIAKRDANTLGVPSTGIIMSEIEDNSILIDAGFTKKGKFIIPFEQDASLSGPGSFSVIDTLNNPPPMGGNVVWTGTEMIVWDCDQNNGGRYNSSSDTWASMSTTFSPSQRQFSSAVWTGAEMIVWGGTEDNEQGLNSGARYNPDTNTWTPMSTINAPQKTQHTAIWTGTEMIVWGGIEDYVPFTPSNNGYKYNPSTDQWTMIANTSTGTIYHSAVWTGEDMIIHGGFNTSGSQNTTKKYNPSTDTWTTLNSNGVTRYLHSAIWTGTKMIVWGGTNMLSSPIIGLNTGGIYNVSSNSWSSTSLSNSPSARFSNTAVWTGTEMIIWGGANNDIYTNTGARFNPTSNSWITTTLTNAPSPRAANAVWTGTEKIIWGGGDGNTVFDDGAKYNPLSSGYLPPVNIDMFLYGKN